MRALLVLTALVGALAAVLWLLALATSAPPAPVAFFVLAEPVAVVGEPWPVRFGAVHERGAGLSTLHGQIALAGAAAVDAARGFAKLPVVTDGPVSGTLSACLDDDAACATVRFTVESKQARPRPHARFSWLGPEPPVLTVGSVARRTAVAVQAPLELDPAAPQFTVELARAAAPLLLDVVVDGVVRDVVLAVGPTVQVETPRGLSAGSVVVIHAGGPWPGELGAWAIARGADPSEPLAAFAARLAREAGAPTDLASPADDTAVRALLERVKPAVLRAGRLPLDVLPAKRAAPWPELYAGTAALLVALVAAAGRSRKVPSLPLAAGVGAVAAMCVALYIVLRVVGG